MELINVMKSFLGWCSVINLGLYLFSVLIITIFKNPIAKLHSKLFNLDETSLHLEYFRFIGIYKMALIIFNIIPYFALVMIS
ncbi:DUF6868 family protein [Fusobacterium sp. MFO224]|uniref:DUF6868 family protein n=1 Tax=Fusobacterium sp. MFO224 TaxID=3378070 RepID=UPI003854FBB5